MNRVSPQHREIRSPAGAELHVVDWTDNGSHDGGARGVLLVHGLASNARMWEGVALYLAGLGHPVAAVDLRGHGLSSKPDTGYDFATVCLDLEHVLSTLVGEHPAAWSRPVVAGQSYGGNVVLELGATRPWAVSGIVCVDGGTIELSVPFPTWEACAAALAPPHIASMPPEDLEGHVRAAHPDWPESGIQGMLANFLVTAEGFVEPCLSYERHMAVLQSLWEHRPSRLYPATTVPVLLVPAAGNGAGSGAGDAAAEAKKREVGAALGALRHARVQWFTADHDVHAQYPDAVGGLIHDTIAGGFFG